MSIDHNVVSMTKALERLATDGHSFDEDLVASISPYQTKHINRFGRYTLKRDPIPEPLDGVRVLRMPRALKPTSVAMSRDTAGTSAHATVAELHSEWTHRDSLLASLQCVRKLFRRLFGSVTNEISP